MENKLDLIYGFNPEKINDDIKKANERATELLTTIKNNEMLASLEKPVSEYTNYLNKIHGINKIYNDRLNIISQIDQQKSEMSDYYTLWAHQIKTPIAAAKLLSLLNLYDKKTIIRTGLSFCPLGFCACTAIYE